MYIDICRQINRLFIAEEEQRDNDRMDEKADEPIPYDLQVLLPNLRKAHKLLRNGYFTPRTWNVLIDLYNRLPKNVRKEVQISQLLQSETKKEICVNFFEQMRNELEKKGYLRKITKTNMGMLRLED